MKKNALKLLSVTVAFCMCLGTMAGCNKSNNSSDATMSDEFLGEFYVEDSSNSDGTDSTGDGTASTSGSSSTGQNGSSSIDVSKLKGQTVQMLMWRELNVAEKKVLENFKKSTGINVRYTVVNQKDYMTKVAGEIASGSGLDICAIQSGGMSILTSDIYPSAFPVGTIATMQPFFEATGQNPNDSIWAKSWMDPYKINGKYYGVAVAGGWHTLSTVIYYNKDLFEENGIKTPRELWKAGNWNWETFKAAALEISNIDD